MEKIEPRGEAARFISLIRPIIEDLGKELNADLDLEKLRETALSGLVEAIRTHRTRQGTARRHDVWYGILNAVLNELMNQSWESRKKTAMLTYWLNANELMAFYSGSAEGAIKRDTRAVILEMKTLLRCLMLICWLSFDAASREEEAPEAGTLLRPTSAKNLKAMVAHLDDSARLFVRNHYARKSSLEIVSGDTRWRKNASGRNHFKILETLSDLVAGYTEA